MTKVPNCVTGAFDLGLPKIVNEQGTSDRLGTKWKCRLRYKSLLSGGKTDVI